MERLVDFAPHDLVRALRGRGRRRAWLVRRAGSDRVEASEGFLEPLAEFVRAAPDFDRHAAVFVGVGPESGALFGVFVHRTRRGQAQGGLRRWRYDTVADFLRDGLRLARAMGRKNALAGLWWSGGKGVIARSPEEGDGEPAARRTLYREFGELVSSLRGCYVTAEDVGTTPEDMAEVFRRTRFTTCIPPAFGGSGNPSQATAAGVVAAAEAALEVLGLGGLSGKRVAVQGVGNVGRTLIERMLERGVAEVVAADVDAERCAAARERFAGRRVEVRVSRPGDEGVLSEECDVLSPNALGGVLGAETIPRVRARLVCGAANNPLEDEERDAEALAERGVTYVPDFVCNRMGIVQCANEQYGSLPEDPALLRHLDPGCEGSIQDVTRRVLEEARRGGTTPLAAARRLADARLEDPHPIFPDRTRQIIDAVVGSGWHEG